jgi:hypothetical protein
MRYRRIFRLARPMRYDGSVAVFARELHGLEGFEQSTHLIHFDENAIGYSTINSALE